ATLFHLDKNNSGEWSADDAPFSCESMAKYCLASNGSGNIFVFGIGAHDGNLSYKELPVRAPMLQARGKTATVGVKMAMVAMATPASLALVAMHLPIDDAWTTIATDGVPVLDFAVCSDSKGRLELFTIDVMGKVKNT